MLFRPPCLTAGKQFVKNTSSSRNKLNIFTHFCCSPRYRRRCRFRSSLLIVVCPCHCHCRRRYSLSLPPPFAGVSVARRLLLPPSMWSLFLRLLSLASRHGHDLLLSKSLF
jgi:hypothetical protein